MITPERAGDDPGGGLVEHLRGTRVHANGHEEQQRTPVD